MIEAQETAVVKKRPPFNFLLRVKWWGKSEVPTLTDEVMEEATLLDRDVLVRELELIDAHFKCEAQKAKKEFLANWLQGHRPKDLNEFRASQNPSR